MERHEIDDFDFSFLVFALRHIGIRCIVGLVEQNKEKKYWHRTHMRTLESLILLLFFISQNWFDVIYLLFNS